MILRSNAHNVPCKILFLSDYSNTVFSSYYCIILKSKFSTNSKVCTTLIFFFISCLLCLLFHFPCLLCQFAMVKLKNGHYDSGGAYISNEFKIPNRRVPLNFHLSHSRCISNNLALSNV